jgi:hypothetical protein
MSVSCGRCSVTTAEQRSTSHFTANANFKPAAVELIEILQAAFRSFGSCSRQSPIIRRRIGACRYGGGIGAPSEAEMARPFSDPEPASLASLPLPLTLSSPSDRGRVGR